MIEIFFKRPTVVRQLKNNSFVPSIDYFAEYLSKRGYSYSVARDYLRSAAHFSYWLKNEHITINHINESIIDKFLSKHLKECLCPVSKGGPLRICRPALKAFLDALQDYNLITLIQQDPLVSPVDKLLNDFDKHLEKIHGLQLSTIHQHVRYIREFLREIYRDGPLELHRIDIKDIREFMATKAMQGKPRTAKSFATSLRSFFQFLWMTNQIEYPLQDAVPTIPYRKLSTIPKYLTDKQLQSLLSCFNLSTPIGMRDRAMAILMARTGLRACEIAQLCLDDLNWKEGVIQLKKSKSRRASSMPLPREAGEALVTYLKKGRPPTKERNIFLTHALPRGKPLSADAVRVAIRRAFKRCALPIASYGTHVLRHTLATQLLQKDATLKQIADILRHKSIETTYRYARVDLARLAQVALPWPEVQL